MGFLMISGIISIAIAVAFIVICLATVKYFAEKKENNSHNDERHNDQRDSEDNINLLTMAATGLLIKEVLDEDSNSNIRDCGSCSSDCSHIDCNSIDSQSSNFGFSDFSSSSDIDGGSDFGGSCDF